MATTKQKLGTAGEELVAKHARCPGCKRTDKSFKLLPPNFKCADLVLSLIHISEPTRQCCTSRMPSSA